jgi:hypothetical protein
MAIYTSCWRRSRGRKVGLHYEEYKTQGLQFARLINLGSIRKFGGGGNSFVVRQLIKRGSGVFAT